MRVHQCGQPGTPDRKQWDRFVAASPQGHLLQTWNWGELKAAFGWRALRLAVERDGALVAGAQVLFRRLGPLSVAYVPKGPTLLEDDDEAAEALWEAVHRASRARRAIYLKVEPEWHDEDEERHAWLRRHGFAPGADCIQPRRTIIVDLTADEEGILSRMKSKWRYNVRLAERKGVVVRRVDAEGLDTFHELMRVTGQRDGFAIHTRDYFRRALELFAPDGRAALFLAHVDDEPLAGLMAFAFNGQSWYLYGASSNERRETMPNHRLQWHAMLWAKAAGCRQYDLWGIPDVDAGSQDLGGVGRFKEGFGGEVVRYVGAYDYVYSPLLTRASSLAMGWRRSLAARPG